MKCMNCQSEEFYLYAKAHESEDKVYLYNVSKCVRCGQERLTPEQGEIYEKLPKDSRHTDLCANPGRKK